MDTITNQVISRSLVCVWVTGIAFPPNWTTLPHGQHMYSWSPASWKSGQPSTTRLCHTLDNHPDQHPLAGQKHIKLPVLTSVGILGNDYYWIDGEWSIRHEYSSFMISWFSVTSPTATQCNNNAIVTSKQRWDAPLVLCWRYYYVIYLLRYIYIYIYI